MRDFLDSVLDRIDGDSLTDDEFSGINPMPPEAVYSVETYLVLKKILQSRESVSGQLKRLMGVYEGEGVDLTGPARDPRSQILIGGALG